LRPQCRASRNELTRQISSYCSGSTCVPEYLKVFFVGPMVSRKKRQIVSRGANLSVRCKIARFENNIGFDGPVSIPGYRGSRRRSQIASWSQRGPAVESWISNTCFIRVATHSQYIPRLRWILYRFRVVSLWVLVSTYVISDIARADEKQSLLF